MQLGITLIVQKTWRITQNQRVTHNGSICENCSVENTYWKISS